MSERRALVVTGADLAPQALDLLKDFDVIYAGKTPQEAYFVKCDGETTTQSDIDHGIVNILVGFAPLKPAEFVIIQIQQIAGQLGT